MRALVVILGAVVLLTTFAIAAQDLMAPTPFGKTAVQRARIPDATVPMAQTYAGKEAGAPVPEGPIQMMQSGIDMMGLMTEIMMDQLRLIKTCNGPASAPTE